MGLLSKIWKKINPFKAIKKVLSWIIPQPDLPDIQAIMVEKQGSDHPIPVVYGTRKIGGIKVFKYVTDQALGAENEFLHLIVVLCEGPIDAIEEVFFDGVSEKDARWGDVNQRWYSITRRTGEVGQAAVTMAGVPSWTSAHKLEGLAYLYIRLQMDKDQTIWRGEPEITALVRGRKIYDPRSGQTAYSENGALQLSDYLLNSTFGKGLSAARLNDASFIVAANIADVSLSSTITKDGVSSTYSHKRFASNVVIDTGRSVFNNVKTLLSGMRGNLPIGSGVLRLAIEDVGNPVFSFGHELSGTNSALIIGKIETKAGNKSDRLNRAIVRFANKSLEFESDEVFYPDESNPLAATWLAEDNGIRLEQSFDFDTITDKAEALQMAEIIAKRSRNMMSCSFSAGPSAIVCEPGDIVSVTDDSHGWIAKPFRINEVKINDDGEIDLDLTEHQNAVYPWSGTAYSERTTGTNLGDPTQISAPTDLAIVSDQTLKTGGRLSWTSVQNSFVRRYKVKVLSGSTELWADETTATAVDLPLVQPGNYFVNVQAISTLGTLSPAASLSYSWSSPVTPTSLEVTAGNFEITVRPVLAGIGLGTEFEFALNDTNTIRGRGISMVFAGLSPNTEYTVFARAINALGASPWLSQIVTTTAVADAVWELIRPAVESNFQPVFDGLNEAMDDAVASIDKTREDLSGQIGVEVIERKRLDHQLFNTMASAVQMRARFNGITTELHDAVFEVNPSNGQITQRAYSYADGKFAQANLLIDGVAGSVTAAVQRITSTENRITAAESSLSILPGEISQRATYAEVNAQIASAIDAVLPVYSFGFFNSLEGWSAVTGTLVSGVNQATATLGDIQNAGLSFSGADNPVITLNIQRTGGTGWAGDLIAVVNGVTRTFAGVIEAINSGSFVVRNLNLAGEPTFIGTVTSIRLKLGLSTADTFTIKSITIGKPSAAYEQIAGLSAQVTVVGQDLSALQGQLSNYVTTAWYNANALKISDVQQQINSFNTTYSVTATLQQLIDGNTIVKANSAQQWIDGANSTITNTVASYLAQPGGVNDSYSSVTQRINAVEGSLTEQSISVSRLNLSGKSLNKMAFWAEVERKKMRDNALEIGSSAAISERNIQTLATDAAALSEEVRTFKASTSTSIGQLNASISQVTQAVTNESQARASAISALNSNISGTLNAQSQLVQQVKSTADGTADALSGLRTAVAGANSQSQAELILSSTVEKAGQAFARAFLGTSSTDNEGNKKVTGIVVDGENSGLEFSADVMILTDTTGEKRLYWDAQSNTFVFKGKLVLTDGTAINQLSDIRAQDGAPGPQGQPGNNGVNGSPGAGFYTVVQREGIFPTSAEASADFQSVVGRPAVSGDVLTYRNASGTVSSAKQFSGSLWVAPTALIAGNLIATGSVSGDRLMAGTSITAPVIKGGEVRLVGSSYMEIWSATPFGPNNLIEWYGPKIPGVNWNAATLELIPAGLLKSNAKTYKDASGGVYFGGTFQAGTISNSGNSTLKSTTAAREIEFSSNGNLLVIAVSFSYGVSAIGPTAGNSSSVICPVSRMFELPTGILYLENWNGTAWVVLNQWPVTSNRGCNNGSYEAEGGGNNNVPYFEWANSSAVGTYTDQSAISGNRKLRVRVQLSNIEYGYDATQSISITTSE